jgi:uncharacterized membrane protein
MDKITAIFEGLDFAKLLPQMDRLLGVILTVARVAVLIGPIVMVVLGLWYFFLPPKEANHRAGFRTYFGMGSVEAWLFTQKLAGIAIGGAGLVLGVVMVIISVGFGGKDLMVVAESAIRCLIWQAVIALVVYLGISVTAAILFDAKGNRRKEK